jgi:hypothetical protein
VQERRLLMYEKAQWMMNQMRDNPDLVRMPRLLIDSPEEISVGPSGFEFIDLDNINGLDDPESTTPLVMLLTGIATQLEAVGVSVETIVSVTYPANYKSGYATCKPTLRLLSHDDTLFIY